MVPTPTQREYLQEDYDFKKLTIAQLCSILSNHNIPLPSSRQQKHVYLDLFQTEIIEKSNELLQEIENVQPSSAGIEFVSKSSKIPVKKTQDPQKPNLMQFAKQLSADQSPTPVVEKRKEFEGSKSPEKRFKPLMPSPESKPKAKTLNTFKKPPSPMMMKSLRAVAGSDTSGIPAPKSDKFSVLPTLPGVRSRIDPSSPHVIADRLKPVREMVAKFDDGKPVKPKDLYQKLTADSDSTLSDDEAEEDDFIEEDSFFAKHPLPEVDSQEEEFNVDEVLEQTESLKVEEWQFNVAKVEAVLEEADVDTKIAPQTESLAYTFFKIFLYAVILAFFINVAAELTQDFNMRKIQESVIFAYQNPGKAFESALFKFADSKSRIQSFDFVKAQQHFRESLIAIAINLKTRVESFDVNGIAQDFRDFSISSFNAGKSYLQSIDYAFLSDSYVNAKSMILESYKHFETFVSELDFNAIRSNVHDLGDYFYSGKAYSDFLNSREEFWRSSFASQSERYFSQGKAAVVEFSSKVFQLLEAAYSMLSVIFSNAVKSAVEFFQHPGFEDTRRWLGQIYSNIHKAFERQSSVILKSQTFRSGLSKLQEMIQSENWNYLDSTGVLLIAGGTTIGFIAVALAFM